MTYVPRIADTLVATGLRAVGAVVIEGPKACGKTATARQLARSETLLDVDPEAQRAAALDPRLLLPGPVPRLIDEWQREPSIWDAVRREVDDRGSPGQFILTGSATPAAGAARHSGAGRMAVVAMRPMTLYEQGHSSGAVSLADLVEGGDPPAGTATLALGDYVERMVVGGWPALMGRPVADATAFLEGYLDTIVEHDVEVVSGARRDPRRVRRLLQAYAQLTAHTSGISTVVARARGIAEEEAPSRWSAEPYLDALRRLMVVDDLEPWSPELRSRARLMTNPKRHLVDPSLAAALLRCDPARLLGDLQTTGFLFESLVTRDLRAYAAAGGASVYHYRERGGDLEVDLVVERRDGAWVGVEVKMGTRMVDAAAASLLRLASSRVVRPPAALVVVTATAHAYRRPDGVLVVPLALLGP